MGRYILAHDLGTSGNKAVLYREDGTLAASEVAVYDMYYPHPGWAEQNPEDWWHAVCSRVKIKAAGSIRTLETALRMIDLGVSRIGSTASVAIVEELKGA